MLGIIFLLRPMLVQLVQLLHCACSPNKRPNPYLALRCGLQPSRFLLVHIPANILRMHLLSWNTARLFVTWQREAGTGIFMIPTFDTCANSILTICLGVQPTGNFGSVPSNLVCTIQNPMPLGVYNIPPLGLHHLYPRVIVENSTRVWNVWDALLNISVTNVV